MMMPGSAAFQAAKADARSARSENEALQDQVRKVIVEAAWKAALPGLARAACKMIAKE